MSQYQEIINTPEFTFEQRVENLPPTSFVPQLKEVWNNTKLCEFATDYLINRFDVYGEYFPKYENEFGIKTEAGTSTKHIQLTYKTILDHFASTGNRIGFHCYNQEGKGKWLGIDIDAHDKAAPNNWNIVLKILDTLRSWNVSFICEHSNGKYGFHIWVLFDTLVPCRNLRAIGLYLIKGLGKHEVFPKTFVPTEYGNYLRAPGKHYKSDSYSDFYDDINNVWLRGQDAVNHLLNSKQNSISLIPSDAIYYCPFEESDDPDCSNYESSGVEDYSQYEGNIQTLDIVGLSEEGGRLKGPSNGNKHDVVCPWESEHTTSENTGTCVCERGPDTPPWFNCLHAHCEDRRLAAYLSMFPKEMVEKYCAEKKIEYQVIDDSGVDDICKPYVDEKKEVETTAPTAKEIPPAPAAPKNDGDSVFNDGPDDDYENEKPTNALSKNKGKTSKKKKPSQIDQLLVVLNQDCEFFKTQDSEIWVALRRDGHDEITAIDDPSFKNYIQGRYFRTYGAGAMKTNVETVLSILSDEARNAPEHRIYNRIAKVDEKIYIDLGNSKWNGIEVSKDGWKIVAKMPVKFRRNPNTGSLPIPVPGGSIDVLKPIAAASDEDWPLIVGFILDAYKGHGPFFVGNVTGLQGSAKSTLCEIIRMFISPLKRAPLSSLPTDEKQLAIDAQTDFLLAYDNVSKLFPWMSDAFCRVSTGGGFKCRALYTNNTQFVFDPCNPILLNGIPDYTEAPDLIDRCLIINQPPLEKRKPKEDILKELDEIKPSVFGAILDLLVNGLNRVGELVLSTTPRMADSVKWVTACTGNEKFLEAYIEMKSDANETAMNSSKVATMVQTYIDLNLTWKGSAQMLWDQFTGEGSHVPKGFPINAQQLASRLKIDAPSLKEAGIGYESKKSNGKKLISLWKM